MQTLETPAQTKSHIDNHPMVDTLWQSTIQNSRQENPTSCSEQVKTSIVSSKGKIGFETYPWSTKNPQYQYQTHFCSHQRNWTNFSTDSSSPWERPDRHWKLPHRLNIVIETYPWSAKIPQDKYPAKSPLAVTQRNSTNFSTHNRYPWECRVAKTTGLVC